jgi:Family of unknown function (DUF6714)
VSSTREQRKEQQRVAARIRSAFAGARYPGDDRLVPQTARRDREREQITRDFAGRHWSELGVEFVRRQPEALLLMSPDAFRFYLPAYVLAAVEHSRRSDLAPAAVVQSLTPPSRDAASARWFEERVRGLSNEQRAALRGALQVIAGAGLFLEREAEQALAYWNRQDP